MIYIMHVRLYYYTCMWTFLAFPSARSGPQRFMLARILLQSLCLWSWLWCPKVPKIKTIIINYSQSCINCCMMHTLQRYINCYSYCFIATAIAKLYNQFQPYTIDLYNNKRLKYIYLFTYLHIYEHAIDRWSTSIEANLHY